MSEPGATDGASVIDIHPRKPMEIATQIWCEERHARKTFDPDLAESFATELAAEQYASTAWMQTAAQHLRNECYYRCIVVEIGEMIGDEAFISDDGSRQQDVLCAKVAELVRKRLKHQLDDILAACEKSFAERVEEYGGSKVAADDGWGIDEVREIIASLGGRKC
jgi:hypothetical protein